MFKVDKKYQFLNDSARNAFSGRCTFNKDFLTRVGNNIFTVISVTETGSAKEIVIDGQFGRFNSKAISPDTAFKIVLEADEAKYFKEVVEVVEDSYSVMTVNRSNSVGWLIRKKDCTQAQAEAFAKDWLEENSDDEVIVFKGISRFKTKTILEAVKSAY